MKKGFTLVEIIIVIMIMSVFIGVGYTTYTRQFQAKDFDRQVDTFVTTLEFAKTKSMARDISPNPACVSFDLYQVSVTQNTTPPTYQLQFDCDSPASTVTLQSVNLTNVTVSGLPSNTYPIQFHHPYGCTTDSCDAPSLLFRLTSTTNNTCKDITINSLGSISVGDLINGC